ncbi:MAG: Crp/Fnr family transcriptional regulator, partial [Desulfocapsaceae bacterium]|nr:Crp/Fnr family transcriptional regulator [Desulfocapsaceae bacterium]
MREQKKRAIITSTDLFKGLPDDQIDIISSLTVEKIFNRGETIFFEGDEARGFYIVGDGQVKVFKMNPLGKEHILHIFGAGEPIGEVPVFHSQPFPASAEAIVKSSLVYIQRQDFVKLIQTHPSVSLNMLALLSMRLRQFATQIENLSLKEVPARLANYLIFVSEELDDADTVQLSVSKGQLASQLGTIPETLSRIFAKMTDEGLIRV